MVASICVLTRCFDVHTKYGRNWLSRRKFKVSELTGDYFSDAHFGAREFFCFVGFGVKLHPSHPRLTEAIHTASLHIDCCCPRYCTV